MSGAEGALPPTVGGSGSDEPRVPPLEGTVPSAPAGGPPPGALAEPAPDPLVGQVLSGRYRIVQKLGEGAMGTVYLGEHVRMGRRDAIKVLRGPLAGDAEAIRRFTRGARNISAVHHPNVCTIYDFSDTAEGVTFLAMELITGESLRDLLEREGALPPERAISLARQVADALQAAHDAGIVHRDLKPANIMLTRSRTGADVVKVVDFDIAKAYDEAEGVEVTRVGFVVGTPEYMSPEQLIGERLDGRSDLYSLALVLFRMLTGTLPFRAQTPQDLMIQRLTVAPLTLAEAAPERTFPDALQSAIGRALSIKAGDRQPSAAEFAREITAVLGGAPAAAVIAPAPGLQATIIASAPATTDQMAAPAVPSTLRAAAAPRRRRFALAAGAGVAVLLVVAGGIAWFARPLPAGRPARGPSSGTGTRTASASPLPAPAVPLPAGAGGATGAAAAGAGAPAVAPASPAASVAPETHPAGAATPRREVAVRPESVHLAGKPTADPVASGSATAADGAPGVGVPRAPMTAAERERITSTRAMIWRQFDRLGPPYPPLATIAAIRDTAREIWQEPGAGPRNRALAAFVVGNTFIATGARPGAIVPWLERAVHLDPYGSGYQKLLDAYRSQSQ